MRFLIIFLPLLALGGLSGWIDVSFKLPDMEKMIYQSPLGSVRLIADRGALVYCNWESADCRDKETKLMALLEEAGGNDLDMDVLKVSVRQLNEYFNGKRFVFDLPIKLIGTEFQKKVWKAMAEVEYGEVRSYKWLAERCGCVKGYRAVASACGRNPLAIIYPCHRIISSDSSLGGYTGGIDKKEGLLRLESNVIQSVRNN